MKHLNSNIITTRIAGSKYYSFNFPDKGDRVILIHNPYNKFDKNAIMVLNQNLQQIGHLTKTANFNKMIGELIGWQPIIATVNSVYPQFNEIFIDIDSTFFKNSADEINLIFAEIHLN